jgi:hypothetical protein
MRYPATSIKERVYAQSTDGTHDAIGCLGNLICTSASGAQGSLGGLVVMAPKIVSLLGSAVEKMQVYLNDPICSESTPQAHFDGSLVNVAACNAYLLAPETSCEMRNMRLDRLRLSDLYTVLAEATRKGNCDTGSPICPHRSEQRSRTVEPRCHPSRTLK